MHSPIIVDRRWPTCISFAIFGDEKSTSTFFFSTRGPDTPNVKLRAIDCTTAVFDRWMLMNPLGCK